MVTARQGRHAVSLCQICLSFISSLFITTCGSVALFDKIELSFGKFPFAIPFFFRDLRKKKFNPHQSVIFAVLL